MFGDIVRTLVSPVTTVTNAVLGKDNPINRVINPAGAVVNRAVDGPRGNNEGRVTTMSSVNGMPQLPMFSGRLTQDDQIGEIHRLRNNLNTQGLDRIRSEALRDPGTMSKWGQMALSQAQDQNARGAATQMQQAQNQLAMQGGLRSGARERLAMQGAQNRLLGNQQALSNIQNQDDQNRQRWLSMLPGQEMASAQYDLGIQDRNIGRAFSEIQGKRNFDQFKYAQDMQAWAANQSSDAMKRQAQAQRDTSGLFGGGGFLGLGI